MIKIDTESGTRRGLVEAGTTGWEVIGTEIKIETAETLTGVWTVTKRTWSVIVTARSWTKREIGTETAATATVIEGREEMMTPQERGVALEEREDRGVVVQGGVAAEDKVRTIIVRLLLALDKTLAS